MKKEIKEGKTIKITTSTEEYQGILLHSYDPKIFLLKLSSGYNIGIEKNKIKNMQQLTTKAKTEKLKIKTKKPKANLPGIAIIVTGGTIASKLDYKTGGVKALIKPEDIIAVAPKIQEIAKIITIEMPFTIMSEDMTSEEWKKLAKLCEKLLNKKENKGIIILQGTDTLHYSSSVLSFMLKDLNKPVVLTYAQRSIDRGSSDALLNLTCAAQAAISDIAEVMVVGHATTNDNFCFALRGTKVRKMHTSRRDAFRPINVRPIATIWENKIEIHDKYNKRNNKKVKSEAVFEDKVALVKWHPNSDPNILDFYIKNKYKGIIIEATGLGHVSTEGEKSWLETIKKAIKDGIIVCFATQCLYGSLNPNVYSALRKLKDAGVVFLKDMLPETAYIKLGYLLGKEKNKNKVKELMLQNLTGEFNLKLSVGDFLV